MAKEKKEGITREDYNQKMKEYLNDRYSSQTEKTDFNLISYLLELKNKQYSTCSEMMVSYVKQKLHIFTTKDDIKSEVWIYKDGIYIPEGKSEIKTIMRKALGEFFDERICKNVILKIEADTYIDIDDFFKDKYPEEIIVQNGILNINTKILTPFTHKKIFFSKFPVIYNPSEKCPMIDKFLSDVLAFEEDRKVFYEIAGFGLLKDYIFEKAFMLIGGGRNGKSKSITLLKSLFGIENCSSVPLASLDIKTFNISELYQKFLNLAGDISNTDLKDTGTFKQLTGRDIVSAHRKYLKDIKFTNYSKFIFACNELPMVYDNSRGFWERWILLDYPYTFVSKEEYNSAEDKSMLKIKDDQIIDKLTTSNELSGFLNKSLDALNNLLKFKKFSSTKGSEQVKKIWVMKSNSFATFCEELIVEDNSPTGIIKKSDLRKKYSEFCRSHNVRNKSDKVIQIYLQEIYGVSESKDYNEHIWKGIRFKDEKTDIKEGQEILCAECSKPLQNGQFKVFSKLQLCLNCLNK